MANNTKEFDFIIVGGGPAGCTIASRLASCSEKPRVLLLEAGKHNDSEDLMVDGQRWATLQQPGMNWGYTTVSQEYCNGRQLDYSRGRGLGGSTAINFGFWTVGCRGDYDRWADLVDDPRFDWVHMQARFKALESFQTEDAEASYGDYVAPRRDDHGQHGPLKVGYAKLWERDIVPMLDIFRDAGFPITRDLNSGNPLGIGPVINSCYQGRRTTATTLLQNSSNNLTTITECSVERLVLEGKRVIGVEAAGARYFASKEVILCAGSLDTPKLLMLSGIGPASQLAKHGIPIICDLSAIGQNLKDHCHVPLAFRRSKESNDRHSFYGEPTASQEALETWRIDGTGSWSIFGCQCVGGWLKSPSVVDSFEFKQLPRAEQEFLNGETVPHYELVSHFPFHMLIPGVSEDFSYVCLVAFLMNPQSRGEVTLQSADPTVPLLFNPRFLSHPYDRRVAIESYRDLLKLSAHPSFSKDTIGDLIRPQGDSDEAILEFWRQFVSSTWHMTGTVKMGRPDDPDAAVDRSFRVRNLEGLRVADMSVVPVLPNSHTQVTAYLVGATCADVLIEDMFHEPLEALLIAKVRNLTLQANQSRQYALRLMFAKIVVGAKDYRSKNCIDTLIVPINAPFPHRIGLLTTMAKENMSVGLLSSPLRCASGLRQLSLPASIPSIHLPLGRCASFSRSMIWICSIMVLSWALQRSTMILSGLISKDS
ncbi:glucose dehydrogenase [Aspergillus flavus]|uniref:Glucose dehydrogenase n=1 Tax=Aspergillus flavus (strain ATCC 200026 / FGSC A1120 / IAM 13836 / NRRL 3357 / JCM 12722 / SRRC 167) TaxID=332952 RepID=A0A7U2N015_ASPFN|nr:glucose dehydrogenase [Aspergillus flavus]